MLCYNPEARQTCTSPGSKRIQHLLQILRGVIRLQLLPRIPVSLLQQLPTKVGGSLATIRFDSLATVGSLATIRDRLVTIRFASLAAIGINDLCTGVGSWGKVGGKSRAHARALEHGISYLHTHLEFTGTIRGGRGGCWGGGMVTCTLTHPLLVSVGFGFARTGACLVGWLRFMFRMCCLLFLGWVEGLSCG